MPRCCIHNVAAAEVLYPDADFLNFQLTKGYKYQKIMTGALVLYLVFVIIDARTISYFYGSIDLGVRCAAFLWSRRSTNSRLIASCVIAVCDGLCQIMAHPEAQNTAWLPIYNYLPGSNGGPPCPHCFPKSDGSWLFGIVTSYIVLFILPFRHSLLTVFPCFGLYCAMLVYARCNNYTRFSFADKVKSRTAIELAMLSGMLLSTFLAKLLMQNSEFELWNALKQSQRVALDEKILRCQAEHQNEHMKTAVTAARVRPASPSIFEDSVLDSGEGGRFPPPASLMSAPPILEKQSIMALSKELRTSQGTCPHGKDCLQEADTVWTREDPLPIPVKLVVAGQHVLCYDHLSKGIKYAEVLNVTKQSDDVQWATVTLSDGTSLTVTADHPFLTESRENHQQVPGPVHASDLRPRMDKILVMKAVPVDVQSIKFESGEAVKEQPRISIGISQPARHSILLSRADKFLPVCAMAVGASNVEFWEEECYVRTNNTFLSFLPDRPTLRRSYSDPGNFGRKRIDEITHEEQVSGSGGKATPSSILSEVTPSSVAHSSADEYNIRVSSSMCTFSDAAGLTMHVVDDNSGETKAGLQEYLRLRRSGLPSVGSFGHEEGLCKPMCWFENQKQHGRLKKCSVGIFCENCHLEHAFRKRSRRQRDPITTL